MNAVVEIAGKQFRVANNDKIKVPLLLSKEGDKINFDKILMFEDDKGKITFGSPLVSNMSVGATVLEHGRDKKIIVFKKKRRKGYQKKNGHRQSYSLIEINTIGAVKAAPKKAEAAATKTKTAAKKATPKKTEIAEKLKTAKPKTAAKKATPEKTETAEKPKTAKPKTAAKKAEPKTKAKED
jgi:large subunit ribosomal protein L21